MPKMVRDITGKFNQRPHYEPRELDMECEKIICDFLRTLYGQVSFPVSTDDLTKLVEKFASSFDQYADLSEYGANVDGLTEFYAKGKPKVSVAARLSESSTYENRFRTTMTHELFHAIFHDYLYKMELVSPASKNGALQICKRDDIMSKSKASGATDWMEWQAGYACGAFLMPASFLKKTVEAYCTVANVTNPISQSNPRSDELIEAVMSAFQVSKDAARVRLLVTNHLQ
ncbi:hypothetical protein Geob_0586 [Geotalea daltonii FRC-32]|uniref:Uncharacterized protein n=1 Tax=Geotalea daltonii (strain DSM 22248 / JCM 15807 / FRC-32) TaxID=316067 RepID=B9M0B5_GEODF|nr:ImmA/IrrE family metallo-endopeptidase [Geotalea daltonii]ACM18952.1 hypothetical protein Geob_0586 [Geotalea daltonii FRC-32]